MAILLSDEEMGKVGFNMGSPWGVGDRYTVGRAIAEAQLKKVVDWGDEPCPHAGPPKDDPTQEKKYCNACWQTLKEEIETHD